ncbi:esterase-like activity of phytase family protein [Novosphingobium sp.]|uniref:esterase-like activity of phytase family protein n=2 Tax=Novosphingobium TaxID=165696 RepID=UPI0038BD8B30
MARKDMRFVKISLLALLLATNGMRDSVRAPAPPDKAVVFDDLMRGPRAIDIGEHLAIAGAWALRGGDGSLGNYSALVALPDGRLLTFSDRNAWLAFSPPERAARPAVVFGRPYPPVWRLQRQSSDVESATRVPATGEILVGCEGTGSLSLFRADLAAFRRIRVPALAEWSVNQGPEAMRLLDDGRLVIVGEGHANTFDRRHYPGLLFSGVPRNGAAPRRFVLEMPEGFRPTELAQLPDGRVLVLGRKFTLAGFRSVIVTADPRAFRPGATVRTHEIARIEDPRVRDNYEGMTVTRDGDGQVAVWLVSDSNAMVWLQRTILLKLRFRSGEVG